MTTKVILQSLLIILTLYPLFTNAKSTLKVEETPKFKVETLIADQGVIWGMEFIDKEQIIFSERNGKLKLFSPKNKTIVEVKNPPAVVADGQGGLMDIVRHPKFSTNAWLYFTYSVKTPQGPTTQLSRAKLKGTQLTDQQILFTAKTNSDKDIHFGSRLVFDRQGFLYLTVGDRGQRHRAQDLAYHNGKVIRLMDDGSIPKDNPFVGKKSALAEIWTYGHRNPQGIAIHPETGEIWTQEHGPRGGDEINRLKKGANYGWPVITYGKEYWGPSIGEGTKKAGMEQPLHYWVPSIAPCGLSFYSGKIFKAWKGSLFSGALKLQHLNRLSFNGYSLVKEQRLLQDLKMRIRHVKEGPLGNIYVSTDSGMILRLTPGK